MVFVVCVRAGADPYLGSDEANELRGILAGLPESGLGFPSSLRRSSEVYVFVTAGAAYTKVAVLSAAKPSDYLADRLAGAAKSSGLSVTSSDDGEIGGYSVAIVSASRPRFGARTAANTVPVGKLVRAIRSSGFTPHVLLRIPRYARISDQTMRSFTRPRNVWHNVTEARAGLTVTSRANTSTALLLLLAYLRLVLPAVGVTAFVVGLAAGLSRRMPVAKRTTYYDWLALNTPLAAGAVCLATEASFENSISGRLIHDIWYGDPSRTVTHVGIYIWGLVLVLAVPLAGLVIRHRIFRKIDDEPDVADLGGILLRTKRHGQAASCVLLAYVAYLIAARPFEIGPWYTISHGPMLVGFLAPLITRFVMLDMWRPNTADQALTDRARQLALLLDVDVREVRVATSAYGKKNSNGWALAGKKRIIVTRKAVEAFTPAQMDWLLAHELAHFRDRAICRRATRSAEAVSVLSVLLAVAMIMLGVYARSLLAVWTVGLIPLLLLGAIMGPCEIRRRLEYEADAQGLVIVGDLGVAVSALAAIALHSENPEIHNRELDEHPKLIKRIKALQNAAERLGIPAYADQPAEPVAEPVA